MEVQKKNIICIAGRPGSGKSTASKAVAAELGFRHFSSGDLFREIGEKRGVNLLDANLVAEEDKSIDKQVDDRLVEIGKTEDNLAIDSRLAWFWIPSAFKVYLSLDLEVAARRIIGNADPARLKHEHIPEDPHEYADQLAQRLESENKRYENLYGVDPSQEENYDLIVDTAALNQQQVVEEIVTKFHEWRADLSNAA